MNKEASAISQSFATEVDGSRIKKRKELLEGYLIGRFKGVKNDFEICNGLNTDGK